MKVDFIKLKNCSNRYQEIITKTENTISELEILIVKLAENSKTEIVISGLKKDKEKLENVLLLTKKMKAALLKTIEIYLKCENDLTQVIEEENIYKYDFIEIDYDFIERLNILLY